MGNFLGLKFSSSSDGTPVPRIKADRGCTDVPLLLVFVASWVAIWTIFGIALDKGANPDRLIRGVDFKDRICGKSDGVADKPLAMWPAVPGDVRLGDDPKTLFSIKVCVDDCSATEDPANLPFTYASTKFLYYCVPGAAALPTNSTQSGSFSDSFNTASEQASRAFGDLKSAWLIFIIGGVLAIALSFVYCWFVKRFAGVMVWGSVLLIAIGGFFVAWTFLQKAKEVKDDPSDPDPDRVKTLTYIAYVVAAVTALFLLIIIALRKRIAIAVQVVKESSKAIADVPSLVLFPLLPLGLSLLYFVFWVYVALFILSVQVVVDDNQVPERLRIAMQSLATPLGDTYVDRVFDKSMQRAIGFHFFHLLWNVQFLIYVGYMVVAGVIADWYFTPFQNGQKKRGSGEGELSHGAVRRSLFRVACKHLGTVAFGSLIIAIIQFIRAIVTYMQRHSKDRSNRLQRAVFCMVQCCLKCVQCCLDKVSKNAFIFCSVYGDAFCASAAASFSLVWRNLARVAAVSTIGTFIIVIGKVLVSVLTAGIAGVIMVRTSYGDDLSSPLLPAVVVLMLAYLVASLFMIVYETAIDTIFLCFLIDEENNKNGVMLASSSLQDIINAHSADSKKRADQMGAGTGGQHAATKA